MKTGLLKTRLGAFVAALVAAFAFLTRLPLPRGWHRHLGEGALARSVAFFPIVGAALGCVVAGCATLLGQGLSAPVSAVLCVALLAALTGGLHLDGVADLFDGLGGGRGDRQRILAIMRDQAIGAHGAAALILVLFAKVALVTAALENGSFGALVLSPAAARWAAVPLIVAFPPARPEGLGHTFSNGSRWWDLLFATLAMSAIGWGAAGGRAIVVLGAALASSLLLGVWLRARIGGLTGDVYGAAVEIAEVTALLVTVYPAKLR